MLKQLTQTKFLNPDNSAIFHGRLYKSCPPSPSVTWASGEKPRADMSDGSPEWLTATEYQDVPRALTDKVERLAALLKLSKVREGLKKVYSFTFLLIHPPTPNSG